MENKMSYEGALKRLDEILLQLNASDISLEMSTSLYKEGISIYHQLNDLLDQAEGEISLLYPQSDGSFQKEPFVVKTEED